MFFIKIADLIFRVDNHFDFTREICRDYLVSSSECSETHADPVPLEIHVSLEAIQAEADRAARLGRRQYPLWYYEPVALHRVICQVLPLYNAFFLHCALLEVKGDGIALAAGVHGGKTTQSKLWMKAFPEEVILVNGDKPMFRLEDDKWIGYGTPWKGKEGGGCSRRVPLKAVFFLHKSDRDVSRRLQPEEILERIFYHMELPRLEQAMNKTADLLTDFIKTIPCFELSCTRTVQAAITAMESLARMT